MCFTVKRESLIQLILAVLVLVLSALCLARVLAMDLWIPVILGLLSVISFVAGWRAVKEKKTFLVVVFYLCGLFALGVALVAVSMR